MATPKPLEGNVFAEAGATLDCGRDAWAVAHAVLALAVEVRALGQILTQFIPKKES
jgi:hypothetical protein